MSETLPGLGIISWRRVEQFGARAHQIMLEDGKPTGWWIKACGHYTALRPYEINKPDGYPATARKFALLDQAKAEAIRRRSLPPGDDEDEDS